MKNYVQYVAIAVFDLTGPFYVTGSWAVDMSGAQATADALAGAYPPPQFEIRLTTYNVLLNKQVLTNLLNQASGGFYLPDILPNQFSKASDGPPYDWNTNNGNFFPSVKIDDKPATYPKPRKAGKAQGGVKDNAFQAAQRAIVTAISALTIQAKGPPIVGNIDQLLTIISKLGIVLGKMIAGKITVAQALAQAGQLLNF